jgi:hypothetical protein
MLRALKVAGVTIIRILGLPLASLGTKFYLDVGPMANHKVYYKGEGCGFPQVWAMVSLMNLSLSVVCLSTKSAQTMH